MQTFRDFMESALYHPERGFYSRRIPTEDFYTAPELHPAFAGVLSRELSKRLDLLAARGVAGPYSIVEMGSGSGLLARQVLGRLHGRRDMRYVLVERCQSLLERSMAELSAEFDGVSGFDAVASLPKTAGVFFSNELVDAFPVHLLERREGRVGEVYIGQDGRADVADFSSRRLESHALAVADLLPEGGRHAVNLDLPLWLDEVSAKLTEGFLITVDYGKRFAGAPNPPRTFFKHSTDERLTQEPGSRDITASVDFDAIIEEGSKRGLALESYRTLSRFLLDGGIESWLAEASYDSRLKIKTLLHPEGMGEVFKVLIQSKTSEQSS